MATNTLSSQRPHPTKDDATLNWTHAWLTASCPSSLLPTKEMEIPIRKKAPSFDSLDSFQSFRIAADRAASPEAQDRKHKLEMAGVLEACTEMMRGLLVPAEQRSANSCAMSKFLKTEDTTSLTASLVEVVSSEIQSKSLGAVRRSLHERRHSIANQERWLAELSSKDRRAPEVVQLTQEVNKKEVELKDASRAAFEIKRDIHEAKIELNGLRRDEREASADARRLRDVCTKYGQLCEENRHLNRLIQNLQGTVRVVCQIPTGKDDAYLEATNHRELTLTGQKNRNYSLDAVVSGQPTNANMDRSLEGLMTSFLDGMNVSLIGVSMKEKSCFSEVIVLAVDILLSIVEDRFYHASHALDFDLFFVGPDGCRRVMDRTDLVKALDVKGDVKTRRAKIEAWIMDLLSRRHSMEIDDNSHIVLKIHAQTQHKLKAADTMESTLTFVQVHPSAEGKWLNKEIESIGSALMEISSKKEIDMTEYDSVVMDEILQQNGKPHLYMLFMELMNAAGHQKDDIHALNLCSRIVSSRMVDGKALKRQKFAQKLGKEIAVKDNVISEMDNEREHLTHQHTALHSDINHMQCEIAALKKFKRTKQLPQTKKSSSETTNAMLKSETKAVNHTLQNKRFQKARKGRLYGVLGGWIHFPSRCSVFNKRL